MSYGVQAVVKGRRYRLEPGDATSYVFSITDVVDSPVFTGTKGDEYVTLTVHSPGSGSYEVRKQALRDIAPHTIGYLMGKFNCQRWTMAAIALAASVLVDSPLSITPAMEKMLLAPEYAK